METIHIFGYLGALMVGLILGLMGSGGSLIAIPIFTYLFHISPMTTTAYSLFVVGTSSTIGALRNWKKGLVDFKIAIVFAIPAFITVFIVRSYVLPILPIQMVTIKQFVITRDMAIMVFLALTMILCALSMIRRKDLSQVDNLLHRYNYPMIILQGSLIGLFTGIVGVGGGFLIIPTLVLSVKLPIKKAIATSLFIIALKSLIGFLGDLGNLEINWGFLIGFTIISTLGIFLGIHLSSFIKGKKLKIYFGWMLLLLSICILYKEIIT